MRHVTADLPYSQFFYHYDLGLDERFVRNKSPMTDILRKNRRTTMIVATLMISIGIYLGATVSGKFETNVVIERSPLGPLEMGMYGSVNKAENNLPENASAENNTVDFPAIDASLKPYNQRLYKQPTDEETRAVNELSDAVRKSFMKTSNELTKSLNEVNSSPEMQ
jgi:hypothetical protein